MIRNLTFALAVLFLCVQPLSAAPSEAYKTSVGDQADNRLKLNNKAEVRVQGGYLSRLMGRTECILFKSGMRWKIWLEGEGLYDCSLEEDPEGFPMSAEEVRIMDVKYNGEVLLLDGGGIYEVDQRDVYRCSNWRGDSDAVIIRENELINYDEPNDFIRVRKLR